jgi:hypothetical protein
LMFLRVETFFLDVLKSNHFCLDVFSLDHLWTDTRHHVWSQVYHTTTDDVLLCCVCVCFFTYIRRGWNGSSALISPTSNRRLAHLSSPTSTGDSSSFCLS